MLSKVRYDKRTQIMDEAEQRYWLYALQGDRLIGDYIRSQIQLNPQLRKELFNQPVCSRCEKFAFHHKGGVMCPSCGHWEPQKTHSLKIHIAEGHFK